MMVPLYRLLLPSLFHLLTGKPRYIPEISFNDSLVNNLFRLFEFVFGRKVGVRLEATVSVPGVQIDGVKQLGQPIYKFYTVESFLIHLEYWLRDWVKNKFPRPKLVKIVIPKLQTVSDFRYQYEGTPYLLAIGFDAAQTNEFNAVTTGTGTAFAIASGTVLYASVPNFPKANSPTSVQWNTSENLTSRVSRNPTANFVVTELWNIDTPTSGSAALDVTFSANSEFDLTGASFSGAAAPSNGNTGAGTDGVGTSLSMSVTTGSANSWIIDSTCINGGQTITPTGTNQTRRVDFLHTINSTWRSQLSNIPATSAGSYTISYSWTGSFNFCSCGIEILAAQSTTTPILNLLLMGVG